MSVFGHYDALTNETHNFLLNFWNLRADAGNPASGVPGVSITPSPTYYNITYTIFTTHTQLLTADGVVANYYSTFPGLTDYFVEGNSRGLYLNTVFQSIMDEGLADSDNDYSVIFQDVTFINFAAAATGTGVITFGQLWGDYTFFAEQGRKPAAGTFTNPTTDDNKDGQTDPEGVDYYGDIWLNLENKTAGVGFYNVWNPGAVVPGTRGYAVLLEELSHALGVDIYDQDKFPTFTLPAGLDNGLDSQKYTITSRNTHPDMQYYDADYFFAGTQFGPYPRGLQMMDILSLQQIYGRNYTTRSSNNTYNDTTAFKSSLGDGSFVYTIWDGGGDDDYIDASFLNSDAHDHAVQIDLRQGHFSSIGFDGGAYNPENLGFYYVKVAWDYADENDDLWDTGNVGIAYYTVIENAQGTNQDDSLIGNAWDNTILGGDGNDSVYGDGVEYDGEIGFHDDDVNRPGAGAAVDGSGDDWLDGQQGDDTLYGGAGNDRLIGDSGGSYDDTLYGGAGADVIFGDDDDGSDAGNDLLFGGTEADTIYGGAGNDTMDGGANDDYLIGGSGDDYFVYNGGNDNFEDEASGSGGETLEFEPGHGYTSSLLATAYRQGNYDLYIPTADGTIYVPNQFYSNGFGIDHFVFGGTTYEADDTVFVTHGTSSAERLLGIVYNGSVNDVMYADAGNDTLEGGSGDDVLYGEADPDVLVGGNGNDTLDGGTGADYLSGGNHNDIYYVDNAGDIVAEASNGAFDVIYATVGYDKPLYIEELRWGVLASAGVLTNTTSDGGVLFGNDAADTLTSTAAADTLDGGAAADTMTGGTNNDVFVVDNTGDTLFENASEGTDTVIASIDWALAANFENLTITGSSALIATGNSVANTITGNSGASTLIGAAGHDTYFVDYAGNIVVENAAEGTDDIRASVSYAMAANVETMTLTGTANIDGTGNSDVNTITGNSGNNTLDGGAGNDKLLGGAGDDVYIVDSASDTVTEAASSGTDIVYSSASAFTLGSNIENITLTGTGNINATGNTLNNTLIGNSGANTLSGGSGDDVFVIDASDTLLEFSGTDTVMADFTYTLLAGFENLTLTGSSNINGTGNSSNNTLTGNSGTNTLAGSTGNDTYIIGSGDTVTEAASSGTDTVMADFTYTLTAEVENLTLTGSSSINGTGNSGNNTLTGNSGANTLTGLGGNDTYVVDNAGDVVVEAASSGTDFVQSSISWTLGADVENLTLTGSSNINGTGNSAVNTLTGNTGDNTLDGGAGADTMAGGSGNDTYIADNSSDIVTESASSGTDIVLAGVTFTLGSNVENLTLTGGSAINGTGNSADNTLTGNSAANVLAGLGGNDTYVIDSSDTVTEAASSGTDTVMADFTYTLGANVENLTLTGSSNINGTGNTLDNVLTGNSGDNTLTGGTGNDTYVVDSLSDSLVENAAEGTDTVQSSITWTLATNFENLLLTGSSNINATGNSVANSLTGNSGNNTLDGGAGNDTMAGGAGDDTFIVDSTSDVVQEASNNGTDTILSSATYSIGLLQYVENLTLTGSANINATGNGLANTLIGNSGVNTLNGGGGNDTYIIDSSDVVTASTGIDTVIADFSYVMGSAVENLVLTGSANLNGTGTSAVNTITGNSGNNTLDGGSAADTLIGGAGNDTYVVAQAGDTVVENASEGTDLVQSSVTYALAANVENLTLTGGSAINGTGNSAVNTITGNTAANSLDGGAGADTLIGGTGNDTYIVDDAGDFVTENASEGTDTIRASVSYAISAEVEHIVLTGAGNINGTGNGANNSLTGNDGDNTLDGGAGNDVMVGGDGDDTYVVDSSSDTVTENANEGTDTILSSVTKTLGSNFENLTLTGASAINGTGNTLDNVLIGNSASNSLTGSSGNDTLDGGAGADTLVGGTGDDVFYVDDAGDVLTESADQGLDTVASGITFMLGSNFENLALTGASAIHGTGNSLDNVMIGNSAVNSLTGGGGDDTLDGGSGADSLIGGTGNDTYLVDDSSDSIAEGASEGLDVVFASVSFTLAANLEELTLTGASSINGTGNSGNNYLAGNSGVNTLTGGGGNDVLDGGAGADSLIGGTGDDSYLVDDASDAVTENASEGTDTVIASIDWTLGSNFEALTLVGDGALNGGGNSVANVLTGNSGSNTISGGGGNDTIDGKAGADTLIGGTGDDLFFVDDSGDVITEASGEGTDTVESFVSWTLGANTEHLFLLGFTDSSAIGNSLANAISGNAGDNTLSGEGGLDTITGGGGADIFVLKAASAYSDIDVITDLDISTDDDVLDIRDLLTDYTPGTDLLTDFVKIENSGADSSVSIDRDGTGTTYSWTQVATLVGITGLTNESALVSSGNLLVA